MKLDHRIRAGAWPSVLNYSDITVHPTTTLLGDTDAMVGGPDWPDWDDEPRSRHFRSTWPSDGRPKPQLAKRRIEADRPYFWIGPMSDHFGHFVAEFGTRIAPSLAACPDAVLVFSARAGSPFLRYQRTPAFFWQILDWYDVPRERVLIVVEPTEFQELLVVPQPEVVGGDQFHGDPCAEYLAVLENRARAKLRVRRADRRVFVTRSGQRARFCGESYLDEVFQRAGFEVFRPELVALEDQLRTYAEADILVFSEGSALHGAQLLGRLPHVIVLSRRKDRAFAESLIAPRAARLDYVDSCKRVIAGYYSREMKALSSRIETAIGLTVLDAENLVSQLADLGVDLASFWHERSFREAERRELPDLFRGKARYTIGNNPRSFGLWLDGLRASGLAGAREEGAWLIGSYLPGKGWKGAPGRLRQALCLAYYDLYPRLPAIGFWRALPAVKRAGRSLRDQLARRKEPLVTGAVKLETELE